MSALALASMGRAALERLAASMGLVVDVDDRDDDIRVWIMRAGAR